MPWRSRHTHLATTRLAHMPRQVAPSALSIPNRPGSSPRCANCGTAQSGQTLVEFALVLTVFMIMVVGLLDGMRVIFYYSQVQEAAREGARWASIQVARQVNGGTPWGTFGDTGNAPGSYCQSGCDFPLLSARTLNSAGITNTVVGAATVAATADDLRQSTITISTTIPTTATEALQTDDLLTNNPITITVTYPFKPIVGMAFGGITFNLRGSSVMLHE